MIAWQLNGGSFTASRLIQGQLLRTLLPVLAVALGCIEVFFFCFFFVFFFPPLIPPLPLGGKWSPSRLPEKTKQEVKNRMGLYSGLYLWSTARWIWSC